MCYAFIYNKETRPNMGRTSTKENKNSYQLAREELGLTREKASELLETIAPERIELASVSLLVKVIFRISIRVSLLS